MPTLPTTQPGPSGVLTATPAVVIGVADFKLSRDPHAELVTYALGSCLGITFYDPVRQIGGMLHAMLPSAKMHHAAEGRKAMFIDTGVQFALDEMRRAGTNLADIQCKVFGGAQVMEADNYFRIGANNAHSFCQVSRELGLQVTAWEISGRVNRTIRLFNRSGDVLVKVPNRPEFIR